MEHYHKLRTIKTLNQYNLDRQKSENLISIDPLIKNKQGPKTLNIREQSKNISTLTKLQEMKKSQIQESISRDQSLQDTSFSFEKTTSDDQNRRNFIYDTESYKQTGDELNQSTIESNNQIFQMVFLNKPQFKESFSTAASFTKNKIPQKYLVWVESLGQVNSEKSSSQSTFYWKFRHIKSGFLFALKRIDKNNIDHKLVIQLIRQIKIQSYLNHPNIVKLYTFFCDERYIYLVMELCYSGQLYGFLKKKRKLQEDLTKVILKDILKALDYMHEHQIIHRDLKPQNILFHNGMIKLCDFGWSISSKTMRETFCGTPLYVSPELLKRKNYNNKIDVWSIGILTYQLLFGRVPFDIANQRDFRKIVEDEIKFSKATTISNDAKDFIKICLKKDPRDRYTVSQLLQHPFITNMQPVQTTQLY